MSKFQGVGLAIISVGFAVVAGWCAFQAAKGLEASGMNSLFEAMKENVNNVGFMTTASFVTGVLCGVTAMEAKEELGMDY